MQGVGDRYLERLARVKASVSIPVIASLNAATTGGWVRYARLMQDAGADAVELNLYTWSRTRRCRRPTARRRTWS